MLLGKKINIAEINGGVSGLRRWAEIRGKGLWAKFKLTTSLDWF